MYTKLCYLNHAYFNSFIKSCTVIAFSENPKIVEIYLYSMKFYVFGDVNQ